jgi:hypothetical protein
MIDDYYTKDIKATENKMEAPKPSTMEAPPTQSSSEVYEKEGLFKFLWNGNESGYHSRSEAEAALANLKNRYGEG